MPEVKNHEIERSHSKRWSKICEIGNYFWDDPIHPQILTPNILIRELLKIEDASSIKYPIKLIPQNYQHIIDI